MRTHTYRHFCLYLLAREMYKLVLHVLPYVTERGGEHCFSGTIFSGWNCIRVHCTIHSQGLVTNILKHRFIFSRRWLCVISQLKETLQSKLIH
ncbi:hypothetical protein GDO81_000393 [Engystomops pustulosus]|uniref:Secreted protein n=1 Tax=Engystomops pustulosus TaxID=76066 RepID=A0AAV7D7S7_ENGPU|nr:hypothetical protein GDO81_000393 [Engystomops pustulosus]